VVEILPESKVFALTVGGFPISSKETLKDYILKTSLCFANAWNQFAINDCLQPILTAAYCWFAISPSPWAVLPHCLYKSPMLLRATVSLLRGTCRDSDLPVVLTQNFNFKLPCFVLTFLFLGDILPVWNRTEILEFFRPLFIPTKLFSLLKPAVLSLWRKSPSGPLISCVSYNIIKMPYTCLIF